MSSAKVFCCIHLLTLLTNVIAEANSVDPDQEVSQAIQQKTEEDTFFCGLKGMQHLCRENCHAYFSQKRFYSALCDASNE